MQTKGPTKVSIHHMLAAASSFLITNCNKRSLWKCRLPQAALPVTHTLTWTDHLLSERKGFVPRSDETLAYPWRPVGLIRHQKTADRRRNQLTIVSAAVRQHSSTGPTWSLALPWDAIPSLQSWLAVPSKGGTQQLRSCTLLGSIWYSPELVRKHNARDRNLQWGLYRIRLFPQDLSPTAQQHRNLRGRRWFEMSQKALTSVCAPWKVESSQHAKCNHQKWLTFRCKERVKSAKGNTFLEFYVGGSRRSLSWRNWQALGQPRQCQFQNWTFRGKFLCFTPCRGPLSSLSHCLGSVLFFVHSVC